MPSLTPSCPPDLFNFPSLYRHTVLLPGQCARWTSCLQTLFPSTQPLPTRCFPLGLLILQGEAILEILPEPAPCLGQMFAFCHGPLSLLHNSIERLAWAWASQSPDSPFVSPVEASIICLPESFQFKDFLVGASLLGFKPWLLTVWPWVSFLSFASFLYKTGLIIEPPLRDAVRINIDNA